jgi:RNA polymerase sigma-70 factor (ECF subfamily)
MVAGKVMTSAVWDQEEELLDNPDFNVIMEECMNEPQKWKLAVTSKYLSEKNRSHLSELEKLRLIIGRLFIDPSFKKKCLELKWV